MYIDGHLKGGFQTVKAYADFCGYFKNWLDAKSIKLWVPRQGEMVAEDYRACLEYVNGEVRRDCSNISAVFLVFWWSSRVNFLLSLWVIICEPVTGGHALIFQAILLFCDLKSWRPS